MKPVFFCAIGGSGMMPLALIMKARGADVRGSDRSRDQGRTPARFAFIEKQGIPLFPQDGSGITPDLGAVVVSTAVEETVADYQAAVRQNIPIVKRAQALADLFNATPERIGVAGTSGKSTTTGMLGWILTKAGQAPTIMNGAVMKNFRTPETPFSSAVVGGPDLFVSEVDESDGSIALFDPTIAVLNNLSHDHKTVEELRALFGAYIEKAPKIVLNLDNVETARLAFEAQGKDSVTYSLKDPSATLWTPAIMRHQKGASFNVIHTPSDQTASVLLQVPGEHNVANALAAIGAAMLAGVSFQEATAALESFEGMARRLDTLGTAADITVIDDFAHNPDKIAASLRSLHQAPGRLLILFQMHGYGPLKTMWDDFIAVFAKSMKKEDHLFLPTTLYLGGTDNRTKTSADLAEALAAKDVKAHYIEDREACAAAVLAEARPGDRIIVMGARDDTLTTLAQSMLKKLEE